MKYFEITTIPIGVSPGTQLHLGGMRLGIVKARSKKHAVSVLEKRKSLPDLVRVFEVKVTKRKKSKGILGKSSVPTSFDKLYSKEFIFGKK